MMATKIRAKVVEFKEAHKWSEVNDKPTLDLHHGVDRKKTENPRTPAYQDVR